MNKTNIEGFMKENIKNKIEQFCTQEAIKEEIYTCPSCGEDSCWPVAKHLIERGTEFMLSIVLEVLESDEQKDRFDNDCRPKTASYLRERFGVQKT